MHHRRKEGRMRRVRGPALALVLVLLVGVLVACERDKGDPIRISRNFITATWLGDVRQVEMLTCKDWRDVTTRWASEGDPTLSVDIDHMTFEVVSESEDLIEIEIGGVVTFTSSKNESEIRNLDEMGIARFILVDENGWKVCDVR
jgi:hypothetical protein